MYILQKGTESKCIIPTNKIQREREKKSLSHSAVCLCKEKGLVLAFFLMLCVTIWSQFWNVKVLAVLQERTRCPGVFSSHGLRSLQLEGFLVLAVLAQRLCG